MRLLITRLQFPAPILRHLSFGSSQMFSLEIQKMYEERNNEECMRSPCLVEDNSRLDMHQSRIAVDLQLRLFMISFSTSLLWTSPNILLHRQTRDHQSLLLVSGLLILIDTG